MKKPRLTMYLLALGVIVAYLLLEVRQTNVYAQTNGPVLSIPTDVAAGSPGTVVVPIIFERNQSGVAALTFSVAYDAACLSIVGDAEEAVEFFLPTQMRGSVLFDADDVNGQLDIAIVDYSPPFSTLPDSDPLLEVTFTVVCDPADGTTITTPVEFSLAPPASFGNTLGRNLSGTVSDGAVVIQSDPLPSPEPTETPPPNETPEPVNTAPIAVDDTATTREYRAVEIDLLANDSDPDGDDLTIVEVTQGGFGQVTIQPDGEVQYLPEPGRNGEDLFTYTISDGQGGLSEGLVSVTVTEFNVPPTAVDDVATVFRNQEVIVDVLVNDFDADAMDDSPGLTIVVLGSGANGSTELNDDGTVTYTPRKSYVGPDEFLYTVLDNEGGSAVAKVVVTVVPFNRAPELDLPTETLNYEAGREVILQVIAVDPDGDENLTFSATGLPPGLSIDPVTGEITGTLDPTAIGTYDVTVVVSDGELSTSIDFSLTVTNTPDADLFRSYMPVVGS